MRVQNRERQAGRKRESLAYVGREDPGRLKLIGKSREEEEAEESNGDGDDGCDDTARG